MVESEMHIVDLGWWQRSVGTGQSIGHVICFAFQIPNVRRIFSNSRKLIRLPSCLWFGFFLQGRNQRLVVGVKDKVAPFDHVSEMTYRAESREQLPVEWRPVSLVWEEFGAEEGQRFPAFGSFLLEDGADC